MQEEGKPFLTSEESFSESSDPVIHADVTFITISSSLAGKNGNLDQIGDQNMGVFYRRGQVRVRETFTRLKVDKTQTPGVRWIKLCVVS